MGGGGVVKWTLRINPPLRMRQTRIRPIKVDTASFANQYEWATTASGSYLIVREVEVVTRRAGRKRAVLRRRTRSYSAVGCIVFDPNPVNGAPRGYRGTSPTSSLVRLTIS